MYRYTTFEIKVDLCAHTYGKIGTFTAEYIPPTFLTRYPLPLFRRLTVGAAIEKNFFDFYFSDFSPYSQNVWIENIFLFSRFSHSISTRILFFLFFQIFVLVIQYKLSFRLAYKFRLIFTRLIFVIFSSYQFRLVSALQILHFDSSTLYLFCLL